MTFMKTQNQTREVWVNTNLVVAVTQRSGKGVNSETSLIRLMDGVSEYDERSPAEIAEILNNGEKLA